MVIFKSFFFNCKNKEKALQEEDHPLKSNPETKHKETESIINDKKPNVPPKAQIVIKGGRNASITSNIDSLKEKVTKKKYSKTLSI